MAQHLFIDNVTIGSDPELFIQNTKTKSVVSSIGLIPGKKKEAFVPEGYDKGFGLQTDNILAEFNIPPINILNQPFENAKKEFIDSMNKMKDYIRDFVKNVNPDLDILCSSSEIVQEDQLQSEEAQMFGCDPDFNAYTMSQNEAPEGQATNLRTTGCHIHIGYDNNNFSTSLGLIKVLDLFLGVPSVIIDKDTRRRSLYGKAGCFRLTDYGLEYRVLSGYFIKDDTIMGWVFDQVKRAIVFYNDCVEVSQIEENRNFDISKYLPTEVSVKNAINNGSLISAKRIVKNYNIIID